MASVRLDLKLLLFNVENLFVEMGADKEVKTFTKTVSQLQGIARVLQEEQPHLVLLNEVGGPESLHNFNRYYLGDAYSENILRGNSDRGIDVGYLVHRSLPFHFHLVSNADRELGFWYPHERDLLPRPPSHRFSRDVAELRVFRFGEKDPALTVLLTHLKSQLDRDNIDPAGFLRRQAEILTLVDLYHERRSRAPGRPVVVAGDFNGQAGPEETAPEFLPIYEKTDLCEVFALIGLPTAQRFTQRQIRPGGAAGLGYRDMQLDFFFVSPELKDSVSRTATYVHRFRAPNGAELPAPTTLSQRQLLPSDHYPVVLTLKDFRINPSTN